MHKSSCHSTLFSGVEVILADSGGNAHARRWVNKQSRLSAVSENTCRALIVAEAPHNNASSDIESLVETLRRH